MESTHLHLMLSHLPVLGAPAMLGLLAWGLIGRTPVITRGALGLTVALGLATVVVYLTGEGAEELMHGLPTFQEHLVEPHERVARLATWILAATGGLAAIALWRFRGAAPAGRGLARLVLLCLAVSTIAVAATAWTGGPIGHPELRSGRIAED